jgi:hypothetical protein
MIAHFIPALHARRSGDRAGTPLALGNFRGFVAREGRERVVAQRKQAAARGERLSRLATNPPTRQVRPRRVLGPHGASASLVEPKHKWAAGLWFLPGQK